LKTNENSYLSNQKYNCGVLYPSCFFRCIKPQNPLQRHTETANNH